MKKHGENSTIFGGLIILSALVVLLTGCVTEHVIVDAADESVPDTGLAEPDSRVSTSEEEASVDPYEGFNRAMYDFNEVVDTYVAEPITVVYKWIFPQFVRSGVANFYSNLNGFNIILNDFLQAKFEQGLADTGRLTLNTTIGLAGLFDVASHVGLDAHDEDFEQTLAVWGIPSGPYLVLPFVGPGTFRGIPGSIVDAAGHPATYLPIAFAAVAALNRRANAEDSLKFIDEAALDPYVFTRESYLQFREHQISDGKSDAADDFNEELFDDEDFEDDSQNQPGQQDTVSLSSTKNTLADIKTIASDQRQSVEIPDEKKLPENELQSELDSMSDPLLNDSVDSGEQMDENIDEMGSVETHLSYPGPTSW